jgi:hypothetical protein
MKSIFYMLGALVLFSNIASAQNCYQNGNMTNCSNGVSGQTIQGPFGGTTNFSNGVTANTINGGNGVSNTTYSNGVSSQSIRQSNGITSTYMSDGRSCMSYPNGQTICN